MRSIFIALVLASVVSSSPFAQRSESTARKVDEQRIEITQEQTVTYDIVALHLEQRRLLTAIGDHERAIAEDEIALAIVEDAISLAAKLGVWLKPEVRPVLPDPFDPVP